MALYIKHGNVPASKWLKFWHINCDQNDTRESATWRSEDRERNLREEQEQKPSNGIIRAWCVIRETNAPDWLESRANYRVNSAEYRETDRVYEDSFSHGQELKLYSNKKALESLEWEECEKYNFGFKNISMCAYGGWIVEGQTWKQKDQLIAYTTNLRKTCWWLGPRWWKWRKGGVDG